MQISGIRKDLQELKQAAALEKKRAENYYIKNLTDEELQEELNRTLAELGFESEEAYLDATKKFILEKDPQVNVSNEFAIHKRISELFEDFNIWEEFMLKYSSVEWTE